MRKFYIVISVLILVASIAINIIFLPEKAYIQASAKVEKNTIIIDAGHGGLTNTTY
jgi:hypothetical protein